MFIIRKLVEFQLKSEDLITIYILYIRSVIEQSSVVWSSSLTLEDLASFERCQKIALRLIFGPKYISYENALKVSKLPRIEQRFKDLLLRFAIKCTKNEKTQDIIPQAQISGKTRYEEQFLVPMARKNRYYKSAIPTMARMLNNK